MKRGFTLIELLVVIAIIGVLASIVLAVLTSARESAREGKAKAEIQQIMRAAELVYDEYGYYPTDGADPVCPKDIVIDPATGRTWGDFINICNDPWGSPYLWDNLCASTGHPRDGTFADCPIDSDTDAGPVGVVVTGPDAANDNCSGDDICLGIRGHAIYGLGSGSSSGSSGGSAGPMCVTVTSTCAAYGSDSLGCIARSGCSWSNSSCSGSYGSSCSGFDQTSCTPQGCSWSAGGSCGGSPQVCSAHSDSTSCSAAGCSWTAASCSGTAPLCSSFNNNQSGCTAVPGCSYSPGSKKCTGTATSCSSQTAPSCGGLSYCTASAASCGGTPSACSSYGSSGSCSAVSGCSWTDTSSCVGTYSNSCGGLNTQGSCQAQTGCSWSSGSCSGSASDCTTYGDQTSCGAQGVGCSWQ